jgi:hypothetical protein
MLSEEQVEDIFPGANHFKAIGPDTDWLGYAVIAGSLQRLQSLNLNHANTAIAIGMQIGMRTQSRDENPHSCRSLVNGYTFRHANRLIIDDDIDQPFGILFNWTTINWSLKRFCFHRVH